MRDPVPLNEPVEARPGPVLVWGAGAMGGVLGAHMAAAGQRVTLVDRDAEHVAAMRERGLRISGPVAELTTRPEALLPDEVRGRFALIFLAVKAHDTGPAVARLAEHLAPDGAVVSVQNGLNERLIARAVGAARTVGCFVNFGADVVAPGVVHLGGRGAVVVGELDGVVRERTGHIHRLLALYEPNALLSENIQGYLWAKLAYGALLFATALTDAPIADVLAAPEHRPRLVALAREVVAVALALGISPEPFDGFDPGAFRPDAGNDAAAASLDRLVEFNRRSAKTHSGVWRDLAVHRRRTEVDAQMGVVPPLAAGVGVPTPGLERLVELIHDVEEGRRRQGWDTLAALGPLPAAR
ncbi:MAG TPA: 2-dehydropantoate 2-reductase [Longimicrobiales bacterium]|nr:2-dehydropantoate 2-reductase [Longimicrobiales bacterium]